MVVKNLFPKCLVGFIVFCVLAAASVAHCQTVRYEDGFATGIRNLRVGVSCYDVSFEKGSYVQVFDDHSPEFLDSPFMANMVTNEIMVKITKIRAIIRSPLLFQARSTWAST